MSAGMLDAGHFTCYFLVVAHPLKHAIGLFCSFVVPHVRLGSAGGKRDAGGGMESTQRRLYERAPARFPVWVKRASTGAAFQGHTANVSAGGMYLLAAADREFPLGVQVTLVFGIRNEDHGGYVLHEAVRGAEVVRIERHGYGTGIAVKFTERSFSRHAEEPMAF